MELEAACGETIGAAIEVHRALGPGLLEGLYAEALCLELKSRGLHFEREVEVPVFYKEQALDEKLRLDLLVEDALIVEVKAVEVLQAIHLSQLLTYLRVANRRLGLLMNFNVPKMQQGIKRVANGL